MYATDGSSGDTILGLASAEQLVVNYREIQQDLTELNGDGNRDNNLDYGEDGVPKNDSGLEHIEIDSDQGC